MLNLFLKNQISKVFINQNTKLITMDIFQAIANFPNFINYILNFSNLTNEEIAIFSIQIILIAVVLIVFAIILYLFFNRKTREEKEAINLLKKVEALRNKNARGVSTFQTELGDKNNSKKEEKTISKETEVAEKKPTISLKQILIKKFKPKIESQLQTEVNIVDFKSKENNFEAIVEISGTKLLLVLDNSGKIIDYKRQD